MTQTSTGLSSFTYSPELISQALALIWESSYRKQRAMSFVLKKRVFQISATAYAVESKKFLKTLNKPSKLHIVQRRLNAPAYDLMCDCIHAGVRPSPFDCCSHILAVFIATTLKDGDVSLLAMRDDARRKEQEEKPNVPIVGNEYPDHTKQKKRLHDLLVADNWDRVLYEIPVHCKNAMTNERYAHPYIVDVMATKYVNNESWIIGIEIFGSHTGSGHGTKKTIARDKSRAEEIWDQYLVKIIPFWISDLKAASDQDILEEIYQKIGV